jgi:type IV secretory pathway TraG/TraD family ATPase VirD4
VNQERRDDPLTNVGLGLLFAAVGAAAVTSLAAALAGWLTGHGWHWTSLTDAGVALVRLVKNPGQPAAAYPEPVAAGLPGPVGFWAVYTAVALAVLAAGVVGVAAFTRRRTPRADRAAWASARDERRIAVPADPARRPHRVVAGRGGRTGRLLAGADCISAVAFGPNGSGKTSGLVVPNVLEWDGPVVMTTTKPQDATLVLARRQALGPVWVVAPAGGAGLPATGWSPVGYCTDEEHADRMAEWLCEASGLTGDPRARSWVLQARKLVKPLLLAANASAGGVDAFTRWIYDGRAATEDVTAVLAAHGFDDARREYASTWSIHDEGVGSVLFTAYGLADAYSRPSVRAAARRDDFRVGDLLGDGPATLLVVAPESEGDRFAPLITALLASVVHEAEARAAATGGPLAPRLLLALDEAANVFRFPRLPQLLTTARGNGIQLLLAYHDLGQLEHVTGSREVARTVVSNAKLRLLLPGVGDLDTLRYFTDLLGRTHVTHTSQTRGWHGDRSTSTSEAAEELAPLHLLRQLPDGHAVLQYQNLPPMRIRLRSCFHDRDLLRLAAPPAPAAAGEAVSR